MVSQKIFFTLIGFTLFFKSLSFAPPRRNQNYTYYYTPGVATTYNPLPESSLPLSDLRFSYSDSIENISNHSVTLKLWGELPKAENASWVARIRYNSIQEGLSEPKEQLLPINTLETDQHLLQLKSLSPNTVYPMIVSIGRLNSHREIEEESQIPHYFFGITSGITRLSKARAHGTYQALREWYSYFTKGQGTGYYNWRMNCDIFWHWAMDECTIVHPNIHITSLNSDSYNFQKGLSTSHIPDMVENGEMIHGDRGYYSTHAFLLLGYDKNSDSIWSIDGNITLGNYSTIALAKRSHVNYWNFDHLSEQMVEDDFQ